MDSRTMFRTAASLAIFFAFRLNAATITVNSVADAAADAVVLTTMGPRMSFTSW